MNLLIISHTPHYQGTQGVVGWGPTIREINYLASLFSSVVHVAPVYTGLAPESALPYEAKNVRLAAVSPSGGERLIEKISILKQYPVYLYKLKKEMDKADFIHVRCPANISLLAILLLATTKKPKFRWIKYAGNWQPKGREAWSYRFQRWFLQRNLHRSVITVNGGWPDQKEHVHSFYNPCLTDEELSFANKSAQEKSLKPPYRFLFVGRLEKAKGVDRIIDIAEGLLTSGVDFLVDFVGDGSERSYFEDRARKLNLADNLLFHGWKPQNELSAYYSRAHFFLLPSSSEGWPKVLGEAMAYGAIPLASNVSSIPQILDDCGCGKVEVPDDIDAFIKDIQGYLLAPDRWELEMIAGINSAVRFTYSYYLEAVKMLAKNAWGLELEQHG